MVQGRLPGCLVFEGGSKWIFSGFKHLPAPLSLSTNFPGPTFNLIIINTNNYFIISISWLPFFLITTLLSQLQVVHWFGHFYIFLPSLNSYLSPLPICKPVVCYYNHQNMNTLNSLASFSIFPLSLPPLIKLNFLPILCFHRHKLVCLKKTQYWLF